MKSLLSKIKHTFFYLFKYGGKKIKYFNVNKKPLTLILKIFGFEIINIDGFYSQEGQDAIILNYFGKALQNVKKGLFVDVGANHPTKFNNSYFFEEKFGFKTIAVEPIAKYKSLWGELRSNVEFHNVAVSTANTTLSFTILDGDNGEDMFSSIMDNTKKLPGKTKEISVKAMPLSEIIGVRDFDFCILSIDIEGAELLALESIDFKVFSPNIIIIENNEDVWGVDEIRNFIAKKGYSYFGRIHHLDDIFFRIDNTTL